MRKYGRNIAFLNFGCGGEIRWTCTIYIPGKLSYWLEGFNLTTFFNPNPTGWEVRIMLNGYILCKDVLFPLLHQVWEQE